MTAMLPPIEPSASPSSAELRLLPPRSVGTLGRKQVEWLREALQGDPRGLVADVLFDVLEERAQLWEVWQGGAVRAAVVTRIQRYPRCDVLEIQLCGGEGVADWVHLIADFEKHARGLGCKMVEIRGRRGWERLLPGYHLRGVSLEKEL